LTIYRPYFDSERAALPPASDGPELAPHIARHTKMDASRDSSGGPTIGAPGFSIVAMLLAE